MDNLGQTSGPLALYQRLTQGGELKQDAAQKDIVCALDSLWQKIVRNPAPVRPVNKGRKLSSLVGKLLNKPQPQPRFIPQSQGYYIVGRVGRGKTMLMDLFFSTLPKSISKREHFMDFMQNVHQSVHRLRQAGGASAKAPIEDLADTLMRHTRIFCLDEFQVGDIANAMILGHLMQALFKRGAIIVMTSNTPLSELFQGRPGADSFKPFIKILKDHLKELYLDTEHDYRRDHTPLEHTWLNTQIPSSRRAFDELFEFYGRGQEVKPKTIHHMGHEFYVEKTAGDACMLRFDDICGRALGGGDYGELAKDFGVVFVDVVPQLGPQDAHMARRFILLVDILYDNKNLLFIRADVDANNLFKEGEGVALFTRTLSRLTEMGGKAWLSHYGELPKIFSDIS